MYYWTWFSIVILLLVPSFTGANCNPMPLYDGTQYLGKSSEVRKILEPISIVYGHKMYPNDKKTMDLPPETFMIKAVDKALRVNRSLLVVDLEHWPIRGLNKAPLQRSKYVAQYTALLKSLKSKYPETTMGLFGVGPVTDYVGTIDVIESYRHQNWEEDNASTTSIIEESDVLFPELYTYNNDIEAWKLFAQRSIEKSKSLSSSKKRYVFIWPQYYGHTPAPAHLALKYIPEEHWAIQLNFLVGKVDGAIIWGGWDFENKTQTKWNEDAGWWRATIDFCQQPLSKR